MCIVQELMDYWLKVSMAGTFSRSIPTIDSPNTGLSEHGDPVFLHFWAFFWNHRFCDPNPIENVVCGFVQAAGRVHMGVKV